MNNKKEIISGTIEVTFGWNAYHKQYSGGFFGGLYYRDTIIDCDVRAFFCGTDGRPISSNINECSISYDNQSLFNEAAIHCGDNKNKEIENTECLVLILDKIPIHVKKIVFTVDLLKEQKAFSFGKIQETFIQLIDKNMDKEIMHVDYNSLSIGTKLVSVGEMHRADKGWIFLRDGKTYALNSIEEYLGLMKKHR